MASSKVGFQSVLGPGHFFWEAGVRPRRAATCQGSNLKENHGSEIYPNPEGPSTNTMRTLGFQIRNH